MAQVDVTLDLQEESDQPTELIDAMALVTDGEASGKLEDVAQRDLELKLVLARAYIDNTFFDEARVLLAEVVSKGSESQQLHAEKLLNELDDIDRKQA